MDRMIRRQKDKVQVDDVPGAPSNDALGDEKEERLAMIEGQIKDCLKQMQEMGEKGLVDRAIDLWGSVELLKMNVDAIKNSVNNRRLVICDICSATLRMQDHITGKQHVGYKKLREWAKDWETRMREERNGGSDRVGSAGSGSGNVGGGRGDYGDRSQGGGWGGSGRRDEHSGRDSRGGDYGGDRRDGGRGWNDRDSRRGGGGYDRDYRRGGGGGYGRR
ncbi:hypothetical protein BDR26DRAFT_863173 [Obelidium mucronatum]|nr:hypothetical protein BDR26DRAFT_863173 [Obelidium mucronatum]